MHRAVSAKTRFCGDEGRVPARSPHTYRQGITGTDEIAFFGEPSITRSE